MLNTLVVNSRLHPYGSIITRILRHFHVPIRELVFDETKRVEGEIVASLGFHQRNEEW